MHTSSAIHREEAKPTPEVGDGAAVKLAHRLPMRCLHDACCQSSAPSQQGFCLAGEEAPLGFSLYYAPPEVVQAYDEGRKTTMSAAAGDVWALGVRRREAPAMHAAAYAPPIHDSPPGTCCDIDSCLQSLEGALPPRRPSVCTLCAFLGRKYHGQLCRVGPLHARVAQNELFLSIDI